MEPISFKNGSFMYFLKKTEQEETEDWKDGKKIGVYLLNILSLLHETVETHCFSFTIFFFS